jgi:hypothetical protein
VGNTPMLANWVQIEMGKSFKTIQVDQNNKNKNNYKIFHFLCN